MRLSHSGSQIYNTCPHKYKLHYVDKIRPTYVYSFLPFGSAIDKTLNYVLECIRDKKSYADYISIFDKAWINFELNGVKYDLREDAEVVRYLESDLVSDLMTSAEYAMPDHLKSWTSLQRKGHIMLDNYVKEFINQIDQIASVQQEISIKSEDGTELYGIIDFVAKLKGHDEYIICDNKTSSSKYPKNSVKNSAQLSTYAYATGAKKGAYVVTLKKAPYTTQVVIDNISDETEVKTIEELQATAQGINSGHFNKDMSKCHSGHFGRKCPYFELCRNGNMQNLVKVK